MTAAQGQGPGIIVVAPEVPLAGGLGVAGRASALVEAAAADHVVHGVVLPAPSAGSTTPSPNRGGLPAVAGARSFTRLDPGEAGERPARALVAEVVDQLGAVDARGVEGVLVLGLAGVPVAAALADWLGAPLVVDAAGDHDGLLRPTRPSVAHEPDWYLAVGDVARARRVLVAAEDEVAVVASHLGDPVEGHVVVVPEPAPSTPWQVGPPTATGRVLVRGDFTRAADLAACRWLVHEVHPLLPESFTLDLVGPVGPDVHHLVHRRPGVRVLGDDVELLAAYQLADVAVAAHPVPGAGRTAALEAFCHRRALVATPAAVRGLRAVRNEHLRTEDDADAFAGAVVALARPRDEAAAELVEAQVAAARALVTTAYDPEAVRSATAEVLSAATGARASSTAA